jgi:hypothetical protein
MSNEQPKSSEVESVNSVEQFDMQNLETAIPYPLLMEKNEIMDLFRGTNPGNPETKRLVELWMEEARRTVEGVEVDSPVRESMLKAAQENLFTVSNLARWDTTVDPEAIAKYDGWQVKMQEWVAEGKAPEGGVAPVYIHDRMFRRTVLVEIERADIYLSVGDQEEAYTCLDQAVKLCENFNDSYKERLTDADRENINSLYTRAEDKIDAITKVLNFLNENAKKPD